MTVAGLNRRNISLASPSRDGRRGAAAMTSIKRGYEEEADSKRGSV